MRAKRPNIILITFDDCRADHLGFMGYKKNTSPFLDSLARASVVFQKAFATGSGSPQSFVGSMTSTYPADYGGFAFIDRPRVLVSEVLQKAGYETVAVHSAAYMSDYFGYDRGWDVFRYLSPYEGAGVADGNIKGTLKSKILGKIAATKRRLGARAPFLAGFFWVAERIALLCRKLILEAVNYTPPFVTGDKLNEEIKNILPRAPEKPLFLWVHYMEIHEPLGYSWHSGKGFIRKCKFHLADIVQFLFRGKSRADRMLKNLYLELYDASISSADRYMGELFAYLKSKRIINEESLLVIFSDHGSEFFEKGEFGHGQRPYNANLHVPLLLYSPKKLGARAEKRPMSMIDIAPTILDFAGVRQPAVYKGRSMLGGEERDVVAQMIDCLGDLSEEKFIGAAIISGGYKFISFRGKKMLFSLYDPGELRDLYSEKRAVADALQKKLGKYISGITIPIADKNGDSPSFSE